MNPKFVAWLIDDGIGKKKNEFGYIELGNLAWRLLYRNCWDV